MPLLAASRKGTQLPAELLRYEDAGTGFEVTRVTDPAVSSFLPHRSNRFFTADNQFVYYTSDRSGTMQVYRLETKGGVHRQVTAGNGIHPRAVCLTSNDKQFMFVDGNQWKRANLKGGGERTVVEMEDGWEPGEGITVSADSREAVVVECQGVASRLRVIDLQRRQARTLVERPAIRNPLYRPTGGAVLFESEGALWLVPAAGGEARRLSIGAGALKRALWSADGSSVLYLVAPGNDALHQIRVLNVETGGDGLVTEATMFVTFDANATAEAFVGARANGRDTGIAILLRIGRHLTICEHRASPGFDVVVTFSPDGRSIYFSSDGDGKPAIYGMLVNDLVEAPAE